MAPVLCRMDGVQERDFSTCYFVKYWLPMSRSKLNCCQRKVSFARGRGHSFG